MPCHPMPCHAIPCYAMTPWQQQCNSSSATALGTPRVGRSTHFCECRVVCACVVAPIPSLPLSVTLQQEHTHTHTHAQRMLESQGEWRRVLGPRESQERSDDLEGDTQPSGPVEPWGRLLVFLPNATQTIGEGRSVMVRGRGQGLSLMHLLHPHAPTPSRQTCTPIPSPSAGTQLVTWSWTPCKSASNISTSTTTLSARYFRTSPTTAPTSMDIASIAPRWP
jgi:hypothetical protein